jgi:predicted DNA-binding ribbon-helix-helix protein
MNPIVTRRTVRIGDDRLCITIEDDFWSGLEEIAATTGTTTAQLLACIERTRNGANLASAIRVYVVDHFRTLMLSLDDTDDDEAPPATRVFARPRWLN